MRATFAVLGLCLFVAGCKDGNTGGGAGGGGGGGMGGGTGGGGQGGGGLKALTVTINGSGTVTSSPAGINCDGSTGCTASFAPGTTVTLTATPPSGGTFNNWNGPCTGGGLCNVVMDDDASVTANFTSSIPATLTVSVTGAGQVQSSPSGINCGPGSPQQCSTSINTGTMVTLTAAPNGPATFMGWNGVPGSGCSGATCTFAVSGPTSITATFSPGSSGYTLTVTVAGDGAGTVTSNPTGITCTTGSTANCSKDFGTTVNNVALTVAPAAGSVFAGWSTGGCSGSGYTPTCSFGLNQNGVSVTVYFSAWKRTQPFPTSATGLALSGTTHLVVGAGKAAVTSTDGLAWTGRTGPAADANAVVLHSGTFYAAANGGSILSTADGVTWTSTASPATVDLLGIASGAGTLVAVGKNGTVVTSTNGTAWTAASSGVVYDLQGITYAGGQFVAVGFGGTLLTSPTGTTWTARTSPTTLALSAVTFGGGQFVAVGGTGTVLTSPDGIAWTQRSSVSTGALRGVASSGTLFVASGDAVVGTTGNTTAVFTSPDGIAWTPRNTGLFNEFASAVAYASGAFFVLTKDGSILRSTDGIGWTPVLSPGGRSAPGQGHTTTLQSLVKGGAMWVAVGERASIFSSPDGVTWTSRSAGQCCGGYNSVAYGAGVFVAVGNNPSGWIVSSSPDGLVWTTRASGTGAILTRVAYGGATTGFVAVGSGNNGMAEAGLVQTSPDGTTWTNQPGASAINTYVSDLAFGNNLFVAVGGQGVFTSPTGVTWTPQSSPISNLGGIAFGNGVFVAVDTQGVGNQTITSTNGITWTQHNVPVPLGRVLTFGNGAFLSCGLATSTDGITWTKAQGMPEYQNFNGGIFTSAVHLPGGGIQAVGPYESFFSHP